jgi:hypothetical protein
MLYDPEQAARVCYAAIRQLREEQGCSRGPVWNLLVPEERIWYRMAVQRAISGSSPDRIQDAWREEMMARGWTAGPEIDHVKKTHPELREWDALDWDMRRRFFLLQMMTMGMYLEVPPRMRSSSPVTAL